MSSRLNISVSDDLRMWLEKQAESSGISMSAFATMLLNEARRNRELQFLSNDMMKFFGSLTPIEREGLFSGRKKVEDLTGRESEVEKLKTAALKFKDM